MGAGTLDDAAVVQWGSGSASRLMVQTVDFLTPMVDDPFVFGQVAAANALSDVYAMGGRPEFALNIAAFPAGRMSRDDMAKVLRGGAEVCVRAGVAVIGGHTVNDAELKFGLAVTGSVNATDLITNAGARDGDVLVLTKPLGTGLLYGGLRANDLGEEAYAAYVNNMTTLNALAAETMVSVGANAATDVTGYGLLGHAHQLAKASDAVLVFNAGWLPALPEARERAAVTPLGGGAARNYDYIESPLVDQAEDFTSLRLAVDPQTSGGLLVALPESAVDTFIRTLVVEANLAPAVVGFVAAAGKIGPAGTVIMQ